MGRLGFSDLKIKVMGATSSSSAVERVELFANRRRPRFATAATAVGIHGSLVVSGVVFAVTDRITGRGGH